MANNGVLSLAGTHQPYSFDTQELHQICYGHINLLPSRQVFDAHRPLRPLLGRQQYQPRSAASLRMLQHILLLLQIG